MLAALLAAVLAVSQAADAAPIVCEDVDLISVAHYDGAHLICFFARLQGEPALIDHRWGSSAMSLRHSPEGTTLAWLDDSDVPCYRVIRSTAYIESWEPGNPFAAKNNQPWFVQLCEVGLKPPRAVK